jgi:acetylglutamate kinase
MVYGGWANKNIVAKLQALNCPAIGLSGADGNMIRAVKRPVTTVDFGFVGDITAVNSEGLTVLLNSGFVPVFCALSHDGKGQMLNTNADTIAAEIAIALGSEFESKLYYCFEKDGVLEDVNNPASVIAKIDRNEYESLREKGIIAAGMLPKLHNCFQALERGVKRVFIGSPNLLIKPDSKHTEIAL